MGRLKNLPKMSPNGRPTKRTPQLEADLLDAIAVGTPYALACQSVGICDDTFVEWRKSDPEFARKVDEATGRMVVKHLKRIREHGEENFAPLAWTLERRFPEHFAKRPEVAVAVQQNVGMNGENNFQTVVLSDLEFSQLRTHEQYEHHPDQAIREVESEIARELSGALVKKGVSNAVVISQSEAERRQRRVAEVDAKVQAFLEKRKLALGDGNDKPDPNR